MWPFRAKDAANGAVALAEDPADHPVDPGAIRDEIDALTAAQQRSPNVDGYRRLLKLRHHAGAGLLEPGLVPEFAAPDSAGLASGDPIPEITASELTPGLLRAGILRDGCLLVRGLVPSERARSFATHIDRAYAARSRLAGGRRAAPGLYEEFEPEERFGPVVGRSWIEQGGGLLAADSPSLSFEMFELFAAAGVGELASAYLGEPALISVHKTTLRKAEPSVPGAWHQDGFFMGPVRSLNLWLSLSRCGDEAPGLDILPRRIERLVATATDEAVLDYTISQRVAEEVAGDLGILRPIFEPGDALFFDELFLHQTGSSPTMRKPRFALENWFFGGSGFPADYAPLAV
jgi:hypothetical protein